MSALIYVHLYYVMEAAIVAATPEADEHYIHVDCGGDQTHH